MPTALGAPVLPVLVGVVLSAPAADGLAVHLDFELSDARTEERAEHEPGVRGRCIRLDATTALAPSDVEPAIENRFTIAAWIRGDRFPSNGPSGFSDVSPPTIALLSGRDERTGAGHSAVFRVRRHFLELVYAVGSEWVTVTGRTYLPADRWIHAAVVCNNGALALYVDGQADGHVKDDRPPGVFTRLVVGRAGERRRFLGRLDDVRLYRRALSASDVAALARVEGHEPLRVPVGPRRWQRGTVLYTEHTTFPCYPALRVGDDVVHPLAEGCGIQFCVVPWFGRESRDLVIQAAPTLFGARTSVHRIVGWQNQEGHRLPVYDVGKTLELGAKTIGLDGRHFVTWHRPGGGFDLIGHSGDLAFFRNTGTPDAPRFADPAPLRFGGKPLRQAMSGSPYAWALADMNGDGRPDLLLGTSTGAADPYWPGGRSGLSQPRPNVGQGKGYGIGGRWLGSFRTAALFWSPGVPSTDGVPAFGPVRKVTVGRLTPDFQVQWRMPNGVLTPAVITLDGQRWIVLFGDVDKLLALPARVDADGELRCGRAIPFLENGASLQNTYFTNTLAVVDLDGDGHDEVLVGGNPGRIAVLAGRQAGHFKEVGTLGVRGGWVAVDTLSNPCRVNWDGDEHPDLIIGDSSGLLSYWPGTADPMVYGAPVYLRADGKRIRHRAGYDGSLQGPGEAGWGYLQPTVADWDLDGDLDVIANDIRGEMVLYERNGSHLDLARRPILMGGEPLPAAWRSRPAVIPATAGLLGVRRPCLLHLDWDSMLAVAVPTKTGATTVERVIRLDGEDGKPMRLAGYTTVSGRAKLSIADWDGDGDWDVLVGTNVACHQAFLDEPPPCSTPLWLENVGTSAKPVFARPRVIRFKDGTLINFHVHNCSPWATDIDNDGRLDIITGAEDGKAYVFRRGELVW